MKKVEKLAIFSPSNNAYSETFIQVHRKLNHSNIVFFNGPVNDLKIDGVSSVNPFFKKVFYRLLGKLIKNSFYDIKRNLKSTFKKHNVDVALIEYGYFAADLLPYLEFCNVDFIVHFHGSDASCYSIIERYSERYLEVFNKASYVIVVSKHMESKLLELGCPKSKLIYNVYGPNEMFKNIAPNYNSNSYLAIGRFVHKKAPYNVIHAFNIVQKKHSNATLTMVGDGPLLKVCKSLVKLYKIDSKVQFLGKVTPEQIKSLFENSFCFIQHSVEAYDGDSEGTPLSILEASYAGLPIVSTKHAGILDVVINDETGYLVNEFDVNSMATMMIELFENRELCNEFGRKAKSRISEHFTQKRHLDVLDNLLINIKNKN